jgi:hypothetical protein
MDVMGATASEGGNWPRDRVQTQPNFPEVLARFRA